MHAKRTKMWTFCFIKMSSNQRYNIAIAAIKMQDGKKTFKASILVSMPAVKGNKKRTRQTNRRSNTKKHDK